MGAGKEEAEFIPIVTEFNEEEDDTNHPETLPILPLRNTVLFPGVVIPLTIGRSKSFKLIKDIHKTTKFFGAVAQKELEIEDPKPDDIYKVGTLAEILKVIEMPDDTISVIIQGKKRFNINQYLTDEPYHMATVSYIAEDKTIESKRSFQAIVSSLKDMSLKIIKLSASIPQEASFAIKNIDNPSFLINFICSNSDIETAEKQKLLTENSLYKRAEKLLGILVNQVQMLELKNDIQIKVKKEIDKQQKEYLLHQQIKTIQQELGGGPAEQEIKELEEKAKSKVWKKEVKEHFERELKKLQTLNTASAEFSVQLNYLHTLLDLPWNEYTVDNFDLKHAQKVLDEDHFGLEKVKERIIEHLAVLKLKGDLKAPILCLYGPPGVGKTSLGKSVARALGKKYIRMSLGGVHDEAEIRGHRKTYIGAMPGRILQNIKKAKSSNPVFVLDEIDKVGSDFKGDPSSALLEVLDPEQNTEFHDNFVEIEYDLSKVMFIATANNVQTISPALRDRMEMIEISGYIIEEKIQIAKRHLIPKQLENHGLKDLKLKIDDKALVKIIEGYTRESGVRGLDKNIAKIIRKIALKIGLNEEVPSKITEADIVEYLGQEKFLKEEYQDSEIAGVVTGLAWTAVGGDILYIETSLSKGKGELTITGNLGDVMKESATIALQYIKANAEVYDIDPKLFETYNIHLHVPEGAIPKDGPSAGITMATAIASAFTQRKVANKIAMTGEITLRGKVLPVGGIKEKILAAKRAGIKEIILSKENEKDITEIKDIYIKGLKFHYVSNISEVLDIALLKQKVKNAKKL
ncbi:MAG TPA: endopeptidase La [Bacteroidales bacterium]|nr:endopeptidase La [Bacteroidales bacterium]HOR61083.1 endopeptidase La [Bacteroidales bacterium]HPL05513.1 endopeptidase La [Bacteroidales bacterium]